MADSTRIRQVLGWQPRYDDLDFIARTAWEWEVKRAADTWPSSINGEARAFASSDWACRSRRRREGLTGAGANDGR